MLLTFSIHLFIILHCFVNISSIYSLQSLIFLPPGLSTQHYLEVSYSKDHFCYYASLALPSSFLLLLLSSIFILFTHSSFLQFSCTDFSLIYRSAFAQIFPRSQPMRESNTSTTAADRNRYKINRRKNYSAFCSHFQMSFF
jgi:hypothetical protein